MDTAVVVYISGMNKDRLVEFLQKEYGGTKKEHDEWLNHVSKNYPQRDKLRIQRRCTIARVARTRNTQ